MTDLDDQHGYDIVTCRRDGAEILWNDGNRGFGRRTNLIFSEAHCRQFSIEDVNADGHPDLLFFFPGDELPCRVRINNGSGLFGPEQPLSMPAGRHYNTLPEISPKTAIGCLLQNGKVFRLYTVGTGTAGDPLSRDELVPMRIPLEGTDPKEAPAWSTFDVDHDGYEDLCVAAPELSQLHLYRGTPQGLDASPVLIDSLTDITAIEFHALGDLAVLSPTERVLAIHRHVSLTNTFPQVVEIDGQPLAMGFTHDAQTLLCVTRQQREYALITIDVLTGRMVSSTPLNIKNDPSQIRCIPLNTHTNGLLLFSAYKPPVMFLHSDTSLEELPVARFGALTESLSNAAFCPIPNSVPPRMIVANKNVGRMYVWQQDRFEVVAQFNPRIAQADLGGVAVMPQSQEQTPLFFERSQGKLISYTLSGERLHTALLRGNIKDFTALTTLRREGSDNTIVLMGKKEIYVLPHQSEQLTLNPIAEYVSSAEEPSLRYFQTIRTGSSASPMIGVVDGANATIEILALNSEQLKNALTITVYQLAGFGGADFGTGATEPHAIASGDLDGDGISDLACLVHDKLIIYPGD